MLVTHFWQCKTGLHPVRLLSLCRRMIDERWDWRREECVKRFEFKYMAQTAIVGPGPLVIEASWSHSGTPQSVELLWTSDQPWAETSTW